MATKVKVGKLKDPKPKRSGTPLRKSKKGYKLKK